jgi:hypothetical protein
MRWPLAAGFDEDPDGDLLLDGNGSPVGREMNESEALYGGAGSRGRGRRSRTRTTRRTSARRTRAATRYSPPWPVVYPDEGMLLPQPGLPADWSYMPQPGMSYMPQPGMPLYPNEGMLPGVYLQQPITLAPPLELNQPSSVWYGNDQVMFGGRASAPSRATNRRRTTGEPSVDRRRPAQVGGRYVNDESEYSNDQLELVEAPENEVMFGGAAQPRNRRIRGGWVSTGCPLGRSYQSYQRARANAHESDDEDEQ